jgi:hypothetical protein
VRSWATVAIFRCAFVDITLPHLSAAAAAASGHGLASLGDAHVLVQLDMDAIGQLQVRGCALHFVSSLLLVQSSGLVVQQPHIREKAARAMHWQSSPGASACCRIVVLAMESSYAAELV